jgi:fibronectin type 3 domain-containing protein
MVALSGAASGSTIADGSGNYTFAALANGTYTVTPTNTGYTFSPVNGSATVNGANVTSVNFTASPQVTHTVGLSWIASTSAVAGYNVYRSTVSGQSYTRMNGSFVGGLSYLDLSVQNGLTYYYVTTAVDSSGIESVYSNEVSAKIP